MLLSPLLPVVIVLAGPEGVVSKGSVIMVQLLRGVEGVAVVGIVAVTVLVVLGRAVEVLFGLSSSSSSDDDEDKDEDNWE